MPEIGRAFSAMSKNSLMSNFLLSSDISSGLLRFCSSAVKNKNHLVKISGAFHYQPKVANWLPTKVTGSIPTKCGRFESHQMFHAVFPQNVAGSIPTKSFGFQFPLKVLGSIPTKRCRQAGSITTNIRFPKWHQIDFRSAVLDQGTHTNIAKL